MCGICGWLNFKGIDLSCFKSMNNIAKHRGPDDEGYLVIDRKRMSSLYGEDSCKDVRYDGCIDGYASEEQAFLALAHRRLSIIDLSASGHQPMAFFGEKLAITFNGEIYNYIEIREQLELEGFRFSTMTDTEVILNAYRKWGETCVDHFNGMWSFCIWDGEKRVLFCSRDRLGAKPFYYSLSDNEFVFASEMKQICQCPGVKRELDKCTMAAQVVYDLTDYSENTLIKDIKELRGGHNLVISLDAECKRIVRTEKKKYWDINIASDKSDEIADTFDVLKDAMQLRTRSDAPIGVLLSGGLDSSCIVSEVSSFLKQNDEKYILNTYTSCYNDFKEGDEREFAKAVNQYCGTKENLLFPDESDTYDILEKLVWHLEGGIAFNLIGSFQFLKMISDTGIKVLLNGQGADETQFGYERYYATYLHEFLKRGKISLFIKEFKSICSNSILNPRSLLKYLVYFSNARVRKYRCKRRMSAYVNDVVFRECKKIDGLDGFLSFDSLDELQYNELRNTQLTHILRMDDRMYMAHSLEARVPFIDYRYVEKAVNIMAGSKIQGGYTKYLQRKAFESQLPEEVVWRKNKMGWPSPKKRWAQRFDRLKMEELFNTARTCNLFNIANLRKLYEISPDAFAIEKFVSIELFVRLFDVKIS